MKISVYDTYVSRKDGKEMHFDILVPEHEKDVNKIYEFGKNFLKSKGQEGQLLGANESKFCHIQDATPQVQDDIKTRGFSIVEMKNCE